MRAQGSVWLAAVLVMALWCWSHPASIGWDVRVYGAAMRSLATGSDPYLDGIAVQRAFHAQEPHPVGTPVPITYVYSPITLPLLRGLRQLPLRLSEFLYGTAFVLGVFTAMGFAYWSAYEEERRVLHWLAPWAVFCPGMLQDNDVILTGNIAYLIYGLAMATAMLGWRRRIWWPFYLAIVAGSCVKAPFLSLLVIPLLSAKRQWIGATLAAAAGLGAFAVQGRLWPSLFAHYLQAIELQFSFNQDFGLSPAGLTAGALYGVVPYQVASGVMYGLCVLLVLPVLILLSRRYFAGAFTLRQWVPVLIIGVILLNPRIMRYDVAPLSLLMALVLWRGLEGADSWRERLLAFGLIVACLNWVSTKWWLQTECLLLVGVFALGSCDLWRRSQHQAEVGMERQAMSLRLVG